LHPGAEIGTELPAAEPDPENTGLMVKGDDVPDINIEE
jgi:hypothetical protein